MFLQSLSIKNYIVEIKLENKGRKTISNITYSVLYQTTNPINLIKKYQSAVF